ncbi:hypothetical protein GCM10011351_12730 [Paraliobacillus quinghaiensis]|uniref:Uncharacterized protein n=1 Tax=Paraliobacillus quinghaiensis TaxID=470815 RepID=A0A917WTM9_9BACI|nr:hypothetical protein [Paraliobacillus quinghaiensis]GGM28271.1 hypothetical protein GCM10011351_12730 [Paraliobacillus quinghaiensis]
MSIIVDITDTFPTRDTLAIATVNLHSLLIVSGVLLKVDDLTDQYYVELPQATDGHAFVELCEEATNEKVHDSMVFQYEEYIRSLEFDSRSDSIPYTYRLERERIEKVEL